MIFVGMDLKMFVLLVVDVKSNLRTLDQWMGQMEIRLKPNFFRFDWKHCELRQKAEEHKV